MIRIACVTLTALLIPSGGTAACPPGVPPLQLASAITVNGGLDVYQGSPVLITAAIATALDVSGSPITLTHNIQPGIVDSVGRPVPALISAHDVPTSARITAVSGAAYFTWSISPEQTARIPAGAYRIVIAGEATANRGPTLIGCSTVTDLAAALQVRAGQPAFSEADMTTHLLVLGEYARKNGGMDRVLEEFDRVGGLNSRDVRLLSGKADLLVAAGYPGEALAACTQAIDARATIRSREPDEALMLVCGRAWQTAVQECGSEATGHVLITRSGFRRNASTSRYAQMVTLTPASAGQPLPAGTYRIVLQQLSANAALHSPAGATTCVSKSPAFYITLKRETPLSYGQSVSVLLEFTNPTNAGITYIPRILYKE